MPQLKKRIYWKKIHLPDRHQWPGGAQDREPVSVKELILLSLNTCTHPLETEFRLSPLFCLFFFFFFNGQRNSKWEKSWLFPLACPRQYNLKPASGIQSIENNSEQMDWAEEPPWVLGELAVCPDALG